MKPKNKIKQLQKKEKIKKLVVEKLSEIPTLNNLKLAGQIDSELVIYVCNCIENSVKKEYGIDKKELVVEILSSVIQIDDREKNALRESVQFLFENSLIKKIPILKKARLGVLGWIKKKIL